EGNFVGEGRVVREQRRDRAGQQQAVAVLVLQPFAVERRAAGGGAEQESLGFHVGGQPHLVTYALEAEHRVVNEEGDHVGRVAGIGRARGDERRHRTGFGDAFLQDLAVLRLVIVKQRFA